MTRLGGKGGGLVEPGQEAESSEAGEKEMKHPEEVLEPAER